MVHHSCPAICTLSQRRLDLFGKIPILSVLREDEEIVRQVSRHYGAYADFSDEQTPPWLNEPRGLLLCGALHSFRGTFAAQVINTYREARVMREENVGTKTNSRKSRGRKKPITYVYRVSETPMSPEEWEQVQRLLAKIIAEAYLKDLRSQKSGEGSSAKQAEDGTGEVVSEAAEKGQ